MGLSFPPLPKTADPGKLLTGVEEAPDAYARCSRQFFLRTRPLASWPSNPADQHLVEPPRGGAHATLAPRIGPSARISFYCHSRQPWRTAALPAGSPLPRCGRRIPPMTRRTTFSACCESRPDRHRATSTPSGKRGKRSRGPLAQHVRSLPVESRRSLRSKESSPAPSRVVLESSRSSACFGITNRRPSRSAGSSPRRASS